MAASVFIIYERPACLHACCPICLPACLPACCPFRLPACLHSCCPVCLPARMLSCLPDCLPACLPVCMLTRLPASLPPLSLPLSLPAPGLVLGAACGDNHAGAAALQGQAHLAHAHHHAPHRSGGAACHGRHRGTTTSFPKHLVLHLLIFWIPLYSHIFCGPHSVLTLFGDQRQCVHHITSSSQHSSSPAHHSASSCNSSTSQHSSTPAQHSASS